MNTISIDKNSDYYRKCEECGKEFMAKDFREKYCSEECSQKYRDRKKRIKRMTLPPAQNIIPEGITPDIKKEKILNSNINILKQFLIGKDGIVVLGSELEDKGFNFEVYHSRIAYSFGKKYYLEYGPYIISRETENEVLIKIKQK